VIHSLKPRLHEIIRKRMQDGKTLQTSLFLSGPPFTETASIVPTLLDFNKMPGPLEPILMQKFSIKYAEARKLSCSGRKNLGMNRFDPWTPQLEAECCRLFQEEWAPIKEKVEPRSPPIDLSISKATSCDEDSTESTEDLSESEAESEDQELCIQEQESRSPEDEAECSRIFHEKWASIKEDVEPRSSPIDLAISKGTSCDEDLSESDAESEDQESCVGDHESCSIAATIPPTVIAKPAMKAQSNRQDSQVQNSAIHYFFGNLLGDRLNNCNVIADNAKIAPHRAIDFDALVAKRVRREEQWKHRSRRLRSRRGGRRIRVPTDNRFLSCPPPSLRNPERNHQPVLLLQDFEKTLDTGEKKGSSGAPKAPQRCESVEDDDAFWSDVKLLRQNAKQSTDA
jgi:hypothetical protein